MKSLIIAAAVALALPAFAADEAGKAPTQPKAEKAAPAKEQAAKKEKEQAAKDAAKEVALGERAAKPADGSTPTIEMRRTLRFESWVHDEDNEY